jgi:hypothetical protein
MNRGKTMNEKDPFLYQLLSQMASIGYIVFLSAISGMIGYLNRIRGSVRKINFYHLALSFFTGGLNGYLVFLLCDAAGWGWQITAFLTGASGAMGSSMLNALIHMAYRTLNLKGNDHENS